MKTRELIQIVTNLMSASLPLCCKYHSIEHTLDVWEAAKVIAKAENLSEHETYLLEIAAILHDVGFVRSTKFHEIHSCIVASELLKDKFSHEDFATICSAIIATRVPQNPLTKLEQILCDADLDYLGREDFKEIGDLLHTELQCFGFKLSIKEWNLIQIKFLNHHNYHTEYSNAHRKTEKQLHLNNLEDWVKRNNE